MEAPPARCLPSQTWASPYTAHFNVWHHQSAQDRMLSLPSLYHFCSFNYQTPLILALNFCWNPCSARSACHRAVRLWGRNHVRGFLRWGGRRGPGQTQCWARAVGGEGQRPDSEFSSISPTGHSVSYLLSMCCLPCRWHGKSKMQF